MKNNSPFSPDYRKAVALLFKEKYPSFIFGFFTCVLLSLIFLKTVHIRARQKTTKSKNTIHISSARTYTVLPGDDLWKIAEKFYGSGLNAYDIARANKLPEPFTVNENQILIIPTTSSKAPTQGDLTPNAAQTQHVSSYVVQDGEYLWQIAEKLYGDGNQMGKLIDANKIPYPYNVDAGQKLIVP